MSEMPKVGDKVAVKLPLYTVIELGKTQDGKCPSCGIVSFTQAMFVPDSPEQFEVTSKGICACPDSARIPTAEEAVREALAWEREEIARMVATLSDPDVTAEARKTIASWIRQRNYDMTFGQGAKVTSKRPE